MMTINFYSTRSGEIDGTIPYESSNRYTVTRGFSGPGGWQFYSPPDNPSVPAGDKWGPVHIDVEGSCKLGTCHYNLTLKGWVIAGGGQ
jgi:hypothetical protein